MKKKIIIITTIVLVIAISITIVVNKIRYKKQYEEAKINFEYFKLNNNGNYGIINKNGENVIEAKYTNIEIPNPEKPVFICFENQEYTVLNQNSEELFKEYQGIIPIPIINLSEEFEKEVLAYQSGNKFGLIDYEGNKITESKYEEINSLENRPGEIIVKENGKFGVIDRKGKQIINSIYDYISGDGYIEDENYKKTGYIIGIKQKDGYQYGYINNEGKIFIKPKYEDLRRINISGDDVYLIARENGRYGLIKNKKLVTKCEYTEMQYFENTNVFVVKHNEKYGVINKEGRKIVNIEFDKCEPSGNFILAKKGEDSKIYDVFGNQISSGKYESIMAIKDKPYYVTVDKEKKYSIVTKDKIIDDDYQELTYAFDDYFIFKKDEKTGVLDVEKGVIIEPNYDYMLLSGSGNVIEAAVFENSTIDLYSSKLEKILSKEELSVENEKGYLKVVAKDSLAYIDLEGNIVESNIACKENKIYSYSENGKWGFKNKDGSVKINAEYDIVTDVNEYGYASIRKDDKWGVIDSVGNIVVEPTYQLENDYSPIFIGKYYMKNIDTKECIEIK